VIGSGTQTLSWHVKSGTWSVVVMRPDGSRGVAADVGVGAKLPALVWVSLGLLVFGLVLLGGGAALIYFGGREPPAPRSSGSELSTSARAPVEGGG
jgi:hypothetical protein